VNGLAAFALPGVTLAGRVNDVLTILDIGCQPDRLFFAGRIASLDLHFCALSSYDGLDL
jgi:predicted lipid carrier protein YhbT